MHMRDLREVDGDMAFEADVCVVGSGPAGVTVAAELAKANVGVVVLEAGGRSQEPETQALYAFESAGHPWGRGELVRRERVLGGTSTTWTGRCAPFDAIDFRERPWVAHSGWPIQRRDLAGHFERAGRYLGLGPQVYDEALWQRFGAPAPRPPLDPALLRTQFWQYSRGASGAEPVRFERDVLPSLERARDLTVFLHANVTQVRTSEDGRAVTGVEARTIEGKRLHVRAPIVVLACGAVENARLLLASNDVRANGLGNDHDLVGRFLMDHPAPPIATFDPREAEPLLARFGHYWLDDERGRHVYLAGLALSERAQMERGLLNCTAALLAEPREDAAMLALRRLASTVRGAGARPSVADLVNVARGPGELVTAMLRRTQRRPEIPPLARLTLVCHPEQVPDPESRVTLSGERDALGIPIVRVDWRVHDRERDTALAMFELARRELARLGLPAPRPSPWVEGGADWRDSFDDMAHPMGTTRMADDARRGVVDPSCEVHGVRGLFVTGGSVFPTAGAANPTLMIVALALRAADCVRARVAARRTPPVRLGAPERVRVGIVGAGARVSGIYLPLLRALSDRIALAGISSRSDVTRFTIGRRAGVETYRSPEELVEKERPDFLIACVSPAANAEVAQALITLGRPFLIETPIAWSLREGRALVRRIAGASLAVGVAEQMPFLPLEELKIALRDAGVLGRVLAAHNDLCTFDYHGIAQLRRYLGPDRRPAVASATRGAVPITQARPELSVERWYSGSVRYDDGAMLHQHFGMGASALLLRIPGTLRMHGELASVVGDEVRIGDAPPVKASRRYDRDGRVLRALGWSLPGLGEITWESPFSDRSLGDEQLAVAAHLDAMCRVVRGEGEPLYSAAQALQDMEVLRAWEISGTLDGAPVPLPVRVPLESVRVATQPSVWLERLRRYASVSRAA